MKPLLSCALLLLSCLDVWSTDQTIAAKYKVAVIGHFPPQWSVAGMEFQVDGHDAGGCARIVVRDPAIPGEICSFWAPIGRHSLAVSIWARGYKRLSLKLPDFTVNEISGCVQGDCPPAGVVDVGSITLKAGELSVERIIPVRAGDGGYQFQITLHNRARKRVSISQIEVIADDLPETTCDPQPLHIPVPVHFTFKKKVKVMSTIQGSETLAASFPELIEKAEAVTDATGGYKLEGCRGKRLRRTSVNLRMPTTISLPEAEFAYVAVDLPARFERVDPTPTVATTPRGRVDVVYPTAPNSVALQRFSECQFSFRTTDGDEPEFGGGVQIPSGPPQSQESAPAQQAQPRAIELGQTADQVVAALGQPDKIVNLGTKQFYIYKNMKVTFLNGKVSDVQ